MGKVLNNVDLNHHQKFAYNQHEKKNTVGRVWNQHENTVEKVWKSLNVKNKTHKFWSPAKTSDDC